MEALAECWRTCMRSAVLVVLGISLIVIAASGLVTWLGALLCAGRGKQGPCPEERSLDLFRQITGL